MLSSLIHIISIFVNALFYFKYSCFEEGIEWFEYRMAFVFSEQGDISLIHYGLFYAKFSLEQNSSGNILEQLPCFFLPRSKLSKFLFTSTLLLFNSHVKENLLKDFFATIM